MASVPLSSGQVFLEEPFLLSHLTLYQDPGAQKYLLSAEDNLIGKVSKRRLMIGQTLTLVHQWEELLMFCPPNLPKEQPAQ